MLAAVNGACEGDGFKIIEEEELGRVLPEGNSGVARTLAYLEEKRLIELRYAEEGTYCVRTMPAGRSYSERMARERAERRKLRTQTLLFAALGAFLGGFVAAALALLAGWFFYV